MKKRIPFVNDENSKRNICSYCISKTYCHVGYKMEDFHNWLYKTSKQHVRKTKTINTVRIAAIKYYILHVIYHMNGTPVMPAISNHDFNTKPYVKAPRYDNTSR